MEVNGIAAIAVVLWPNGLDLLDLLHDKGCQTASVITNKVENVCVYDGI